MEKLLRRWLRFSTAGPALVRFYVVPHVKIHHIVKSDASFHNHPWNALSVVFGSYEEEIEGRPGRITRRGFNYLPARRRHKVILSRPVWTLFIHGSRTNPAWSYGEATNPWEGSDQERQRKAA